MRVGLRVCVTMGLFTCTVFVCLCAWCALCVCLCFCFCLCVCVCAFWDFWFKFFVSLLTPCVCCALLFGVSHGVCVCAFVYVYHSSMHVRVCCLCIFVFYCVVSRFVRFVLLVFCCVSVGEDCFFPAWFRGFPDTPATEFSKHFHFRLFPKILFQLGILLVSS